MELGSWLLYLNRKIGLGENPGKESLVYSVAKNLFVDEESTRVIEADSKRTFNADSGDDRNK